jgi:hypothetical protein
MILYIDIVSRKIISSPRLKRDVTRIEVKRGDIIPLSIVFVQNGKSIEIDNDNIITLCAKVKNDNNGLPMVLANSFSLVTNGNNYSYYGLVHLNGSILADYINEEVSPTDDILHVDLQMEINWTNEDTMENNTTNTIVLRVIDDIYKGSEAPPDLEEGVPFEFPNGFKTDTIDSLTENATIVVSATMNVDGLTLDGEESSIEILGENGHIFTEGNGGYISTSGSNATISTSGPNAYMATFGGAYIESSGTFNFSSGTFPDIVKTTLIGTQTANRSISFPNRSGTIALNPAGPYSNNAAAIAAGLPVGALYYHSNGAVHVRLP